LPSSPRRGRVSGESRSPLLLFSASLSFLDLLPPEEVQPRPLPRRPRRQRRGLLRVGHRGRQGCSFVVFVGGGRGRAAAEALGVIVDDRDADERSPSSSSLLFAPLFLLFLAALLFLFGLLGVGVVPASAAVGVFACVGGRG